MGHASDRWITTTSIEVGPVPSERSHRVPLALCKGGEVLVGKDLISSDDHRLRN